MTRNQAVAAAAQQGDTVTGTEPAFEIDGQQYRVGDRVRFSKAGMPSNQDRVYEITATAVDGITARVDGCTYQLSRGDIAAIGIMHADQKRGHHGR